MTVGNESIAATLHAASQKSTREVDWPRNLDRHEYPSEIFGRNVFTLKTLQQTLPKPVYALFLEQIKVRAAFQKSYLKKMRNVF
jgi:glutamine synthetase